MEQPVHYWVPSIAPSGLAIYEGDLFPEWKGYLFIGALVNQEVRRLEVSRGRIEEEAVFSEISARIRDVRSGPDGAIYILSPDSVYRVAPTPAP
jgi:glucose/arabinose dehydrogenase